MAVIPSSKLVEFIKHQFDQMLCLEEERKEQQSDFNKEIGRKSKKINRDNALNEEEKDAAFKKWKKENEFRTKKLILSGKQRLDLNIFVWQCWYLISKEIDEKEIDENDKDIFEWIAGYISDDRGYLKHLPKTRKFKKYTFNDIKRILELVEMHNIQGESEHLKALTNHLYGTFTDNIPIESEEIQPDYELLRSLPPDLDKF
jgi:hypothetical protein